MSGDNRDAAVRHDRATEITQLKDTQQLKLYSSCSQLPRKTSLTSSEGCGSSVGDGGSRDADSQEKREEGMSSWDAALFIAAELAGAGLLALSEAIANIGNTQRGAKLTLLQDKK